MPKVNVNFSGFGKGKREKQDRAFRLFQEDLRLHPDAYTPEEIANVMDSINKIGKFLPVRKPAPAQPAGQEEVPDPYENYYLEPGKKPVSLGSTPGVKGKSFLGKPVAGAGDGGDTSVNVGLSPTQEQNYKKALAALTSGKIVTWDNSNPEKPKLITTPIESSEMAKEMIQLYGFVPEEYDEFMKLINSKYKPAQKKKTLKEIIVGAATATGEAVGGAVSAGKAGLGKLAKGLGMDQTKTATAEQPMKLTEIPMGQIGSKQKPFKDPSQVSLDQYEVGTVFWLIGPDGVARKQVVRE